MYVLQRMGIHRAQLLSGMSRKNKGRGRVFSGTYRFTIISILATSASVIQFYLRCGQWQWRRIPFRQPPQWTGTKHFYSTLINDLTYIFIDKFPDETALRYKCTYPDPEALYALLIPIFFPDLITGHEVENSRGHGIHSPRHLPNPIMAWACASHDI